MKGRKPAPAETKRKTGRTNTTDSGGRELGDPVLPGGRLAPVELYEPMLVLRDDGSVKVGDSIVPASTIPPLPDHLALYDELSDETQARDLWRSIVAVLVDGNYLTLGDTFLLSSLVEAVLFARKAFAELPDSTSMFVETMNPHSGRSSIKAHPAFKLWKDSTATMLKVAEHYGLTPVARARLGLAVGKGRQIEKELGDGLPPSGRDMSGDAVEGTASDPDKGLLDE